MYLVPFIFLFLLLWWHSLGSPYQDVGTMLLDPPAISTMSQVNLFTYKLLRLRYLVIVIQNITFSLSQEVMFKSQDDHLIRVL